jgi:hypothetical protein
VIRDIHDADDVRNMRSKDGLNALPHRDCCEATALTPAFKSDAGPALVDANQRDLSAVRRHSRIDLFVSRS